MKFGIKIKSDQMIRDEIEEEKINKNKIKTKQITIKRITNWVKKKQMKGHIYSLAKRRERKKKEKKRSSLSPTTAMMATRSASLEKTWRVVLNTTLEDSVWKEKDATNIV